MPRIEGINEKTYEMWTCPSCGQLRAEVKINIGNPGNNAHTLSRYIHCNPGCGKYFLPDGTEYEPMTGEITIKRKPQIKLLAEDIREILLSGYVKIPENSGLKLTATDLQALKQEVRLNYIRDNHFRMVIDQQTAALVKLFDHVYSRR